MTMYISVDTSKQYSITVPDPNGFLFDEIVYTNALDLLNGMVDIWPQIQREFVNSEVELNDDGHASGEFIKLCSGITNPYANDLLFGFAKLKGRVNAQYAPPDPTNGYDATVVLSTRSNKLSGKISRKTKNYLFHEFIHHIDTVDKRPFLTGMEWNDDGSRFIQYYTYFNTPHEQRAYFYTAVYSMTQGFFYRVAKKMGLLAYRKVFNLLVAHDEYFNRFNKYTLMPSNYEYHQKRLDDLFEKLQKV